LIESRRPEVITITTATSVRAEPIKGIHDVSTHTAQAQKNESVECVLETKRAQLA
jgi:hypothetical protein